jgi:tetratricopeptide (TPR) repeat protein
VSRERAPNGRLRLEPGAVLAGRVLTVQQAIRRGEALRLSELVLLGPLEFGPFEYAHAWSLVYFLNQSPQHRRGFEDFQRRLYSLRGIDYERVEAQTWTGFAKRVDPEDTLALLLGRLRLDAAELEREWKSFVSALAVDGPEARLERGYELVRSGTALGQPELRERALADLIAAVEGGLRDPRAWVGLGWIRIHEGRRQQAAAEFRRAVAMDPLNARYRFDLAYALSGLREPEGHADGPALDLLEARRQFGLCTELDPENERYRSVYAALVAQLEESD